MRTTFSRLFSVTALIVLVAVVGLGMSFRVMVKNYLAAEQQEALQAKAATVTELTADYAGFASAYGLDVSTKFHKTLSFASQFSQTDILVCDTQGQVITCSCQEFWCRHIGLYLDPDYVQEVLLHGEDSRTGILTDVYEENRYLVARVCTMSDGSVGGLVIASEPVQGTGQILSQMTQIFVFVALIVLLLTVMCFSIFTQNLCRPLKAMANAAREFGHGNLKARVETDGDYTQEIDELAVAFNNPIEAVYPKTEIQQCIIHQIRNSTKFVSYKDIKKLMADLKLVYAAPTEETALNELELFKDKWDSKYPKIYKSWNDNWATLSTYFKYPEAVRRLIYTTNAIEGFNRQLWKVTKSKTVFPSDDSLLKMLYLATMDITKKWTGHRQDWGQIHSQLEIYFEERLAGRNL